MLFSCGGDGRSGSGSVWDGLSSDGSERSSEISSEISSGACCGMALLVCGMSGVGSGSSQSEAMWPLFLHLLHSISGHFLLE